MGNAFTLRMPAGIAGDVTRQEHSTIEGQLIDDTTNTPTLYGIPVVMVSGKLQMHASDSQTTYGFLVRPYPMQPDSASEALGTATPSETQINNVLRRGYMTVKCYAGTPVKNAQVYVRWGVDSGTQGTVEASGSGDQDAITGCYFMGTADSNGFVEISYNL
jgi:hypothetical protein